MSKDSENAKRFIGFVFKGILRKNHCEPYFKYLHERKKNKIKREKLRLHYNNITYNIIQQNRKFNKPTTIKRI